MKSHATRPDQHLLEIEEAQNNKTTNYLNKSRGFKSIDISVTYYRSHIQSCISAHLIIITLEVLFFYILYFNILLYCIRITFGF